MAGEAAKFLMEVRLVNAITERDYKFALGGLR